MFTFSRAVSKHIGIVASVASFCLFFAYAKEYAFNLSTTECAGIMFGALALGFLLDGSVKSDPRLLGIGAALLSVALFARAGPFFVLPALFIWALVCIGNKSGLWRVAVVVGAGAAAGLLIQVGVVALSGGSIASSHSNFSYTLYGLAVGGNGWTAVMTDHPNVVELFAQQGDEAAAREIYALAMQAISNDPMQLARALWANFQHFLRQPMFENPGERLNGLPNLLWWLGAIAIIFQRRNPVCSLTGALNVGVALSASVIGYDGGPRVFAAGFAIQVAQAAIGLNLGLRIVLDGVRKFEMMRRGDFPGPGRFEYALAILAVLLVLLPVTPLRRLFAQQAASDPPCHAALRSIVLRPGYDTHYLAIVPGAKSTDVFQMRVAPERLERRFSDTWYKRDFLSLPKPITVFRAWPLNLAKPEKEVTFFAAGDLSQYRYKAIHVCLDDREAISIEGLSYSRAVSVRLVPAVP
jgi:energy-coupling factor transporter transmembrane protein EcfT